MEISKSGGCRKKCFRMEFFNLYVFWCRENTDKEFKGSVDHWNLLSEAKFDRKRLR